MQPYKKEYTTLGIAAAGCYATCPPVQYGNGTTVESSVSIPDSRLIPYLGDLADGGVVIDKRPCIKRDDFVHWIVKGPMLKESLPGGCRNVPFSRDIIPCDDPKACGGYDYIALDLYMELWRGLGARIGTRVGDVIKWEDGEVFPIPPEEERFQS